MESFHTYEEDLVRFMYRDLDADAAMALADGIDSDSEMRQAYDELLAAKHQLPKALFNPSEQTLENILRYSRQTALEPHV